MFAPFLVGFALCISDSNADLPQHLLVDLADRCSQRSDGCRSIEIKDRHEIFVVEEAGHDGQIAHILFTLKQFFDALLDAICDFP